VIHQVVDLGKRLEVVAVDLTGTPGEILRQIEELAERVRTAREAVQDSTNLSNSSSSSLPR
jgi:hypothetical protein